MSVTWRIPLTQPYAYLEVTAEDAAAFSELADSLFGEGTSTRILAEGVVSAVLGASVETAREVVDTAPATPAPSPAPSTGLTCPQCGVGRIITKERKDKKGSFDGCDQFPRCNYIVRDRAA